MLLRPVKILLKPSLLQPHQAAFSNHFFKLRSMTTSSPTAPEGFFFAGTMANFTHETQEIFPIDTPFNKRIAIVNRNKKLSAIINICPHAGVSLHKGQCVDIEDMGIVWGSAIVCAAHGWSFDLDTGSCGNTRFVIDVHEVKQEGENVFVSLKPKNANVQGPRRDFGGKESETF
ncbi:hypothetical protein BDR26DRAFT_873741 [Obelidium mucronatum]|nr:hypothetical protein BDR26DRAFT_873741 [Obelidium mucronatum]